LLDWSGSNRTIKAADEAVFSAATGSAPSFQSLIDAMSESVDPLSIIVRQFSAGQTGMKVKL
jgi:hypothetical protein